MLERNPTRGEVYHVDFPQPTGRHYAIIVSDDSVNVHSNTVVMALITSRHMDNIWPYQMKVPKRMLSKPSKIVCKDLFTIPKSWIITENYVDSLDEKEIQGLDTALSKALGLWGW